MQFCELKKSGFFVKIRKFSSFSKIKKNSTFWTFYLLIVLPFVYSTFWLLYLLSFYLLYFYVLYVSPWPVLWLEFTYVSSLQWQIHKYFKINEYCSKNKISINLRNSEFITFKEGTHSLLYFRAGNFRMVDIGINA